jgi:hypothetical protein
MPEAAHQRIHRGSPSRLRRIPLQPFAKCRVQGRVPRPRYQSRLLDQAFVRTESKGFHTAAAYTIFVCCLTFMHYAIVGTDHELQRSDSADKGLEKKIAAIITGGGVAFVAEEVDANKDVDTFGRELSRKMIGENTWLSIDMTDGRRKDAGIYDVLEPNSRYAPGFRNGKFFPACRYFRRADGIREDFWLDRIEERCKELEITEGTVVVTCGYMHSHYLREKARKRGHTVTLEEYLPYDSKDRHGELIVCD